MVGDFVGNSNIGGIKSLKAEGNVSIQGTIANMESIFANGDVKITGSNTSCCQ